MTDRLPARGVFMALAALLLGAGLAGLFVARALDDDATVAAVTVAHRVNAGGPALPGSPGWAADTAARPSKHVNTGIASSTGATIALDPSVPAGTPAALFKDERWDLPEAPTMTWNFPVEPGRYEVRLYLAEIYGDAFEVGARRFDVVIESEKVLDDYDVFAAVGPNRGLMKAYRVTADRMLNVAFVHRIENPAVAGIEVLSLGRGAEPEPASTPAAAAPSTAAPSNAATTTEAPAVVAEAPGPLFFRGDFETGNFDQWPVLHDLGPRYHPEQSLSRVVERPEGGEMARIVVSESLPRGNSDSGQMSMLAHEVSPRWEREGAETWYRVSMLLPSGTDRRYPGMFHPKQPPPDGWNTFLSWHEYQVGDMSPAIGRSTWCKASPGCLQVKWVGGRGTTYYVDDEDPRTGRGIPIRFDHWYDILVHVKWSADEDKGVAEVWVDGRKIFGPGIQGVQATIATLWRTEAGQPAGTYFTLGHYRRHPHLSGIADYGDDTVYFDQVFIGPTRASVGG